MHAEAQALARRQQQQQQQIQPVQAQGVLAEMAESMRLADVDGQSPREVRTRVPTLCYGRAASAAYPSA